MYQMVQREVNHRHEEDRTMGTKVIEKTVWTKARPDQVFAVLADSGRWPEWSSED